MEGINPLPSPFTSCVGFTRSRRSILSWVVVPSREDHQQVPIPGIILSCTWSLPASREALYFRVLRTNRSELPPKRRSIPYRLSTLLPPQGLSDLHGRAYGFTLCTEVPHSPLHTLLGHAFHKPEHSMRGVSGPVDSRLPSRPRWTRWITPNSCASSEY